MKNNFNKKVLDHFRKADTILYQTALSLKCTFKTEKKEKKYYFQHLCNEVISQQLSGKAAEAIFKRFLNLFENNEPTAELMLKLSGDELRSVGMSWAKVRSLGDLSQKVSNGLLEIEKLDDLSSQKVIDQLVLVKGIGTWTAEMFLMFTLGREDIFSHKDLGLKKAIQKLYKLENPSQEEVEKIVSKWSPYKTFACRVLWKSLEYN